MKRISFLSMIFIAFASLAPLAESQGKVDPPVIAPAEGFPRGAQRTPFPKIIESIKSGKSGVYRATTPPPSVITVPKRLSFWGNNQYGDCVSAESVFAIADYSTALGLEEIFVTDTAVVAWARSHGYLNGADLLSVIHSMQSDGIKDEKGTLRKVGKPSSVDFSNEDTLKSAIAQGPVSVAIDAGALPSGAGNKSGWYSFGNKNAGNTDHCVSLAGYGPTVDLFKALGVSVPANAPASGYYLYTWSTIGVVDHQWILGTVVEAWVRNPTVMDLGPPPPPIPSAITVSVANVAGVPGVPVKLSPTANGGVSPYIFLTEYGDGTQDAASQHTYKTAGAYTITVTAVDSKGSLGTGTCIAAIGTTPTPPPGPGPGPIPSGLTLTLPQATPAGTYQLVLPSDLDEIQRRLDSIRGNSKEK